MSLILRDHRALFLHIPKTGGVWVEEALKAIGVQVEFAKTKEGVTWRHALLKDCLDRFEFVFSFVRHPLSWYESWWKFQTAGDWYDHEPGVWHPQRVLGCCASNDFSEFIELCLAHEPAYVTRLYEWYLGPQECDFVNFIGRYENIADHLILALRRMSIEFDEEVLRSTLPANVSPERFGRPQWREDLKTRVLEIEGAAIRRFYTNEAWLGRYLR